MGILNIFKKREKKEAGKKKVDSRVSASVAKDEQKAAAKRAPEIKGEQKITTKQTTATQTTASKPAVGIKDKKKPAKKDPAKYSQVLIKPVVTEKTAELGVLNKYVFEVAPSMNKTEIKKAVGNIYGVVPVSVNIIKVSGKNVRYGRSFGRQKNRKKAVVTLKQGDKIEIYHGV